MFVYNYRITDSAQEVSELLNDDDVEGFFEIKVMNIHTDIYYMVK